MCIYLQFTKEVQTFPDPIQYPNKEPIWPKEKVRRFAEMASSITLAVENMPHVIEFLTGERKLTDKFTLVMGSGKVSIKAITMVTI